jgi:hypothetical protein
VTANFISFVLYCPKCGARLQAVSEYHDDTLDQWNRCYYCGWESEHIKSVTTYTPSDWSGTTYRGPYARLHTYVLQEDGTLRESLP